MYANYMFSYDPHFTSNEGDTYVEKYKWVM